MKKIGLTYILVFVIILVMPKLLYSQNTVSFNADVVAVGSYKEVKNDNTKYEWYKFDAIIVVDFVNNSIKVGRSTFKILEKHYLGSSSYAFKCVHTSDNEKYKISFGAEGGLKSLSILKGDVIRTYFGGVKNIKGMPNF